MGRREYFQYGIDTDWAVDHMVNYNSLMSASYTLLLSKCQYMLQALIECLDEGDGANEQRSVQINMYRPSDLI
jgi:hypothetical protein